MSNHLRRIITAAIAIPIIILICMAGGIFFLSFIILISSLALIEFYKLAERKGAKPLLTVGVLAGILVNLSFYHVKLRDFTVGLLETYGILIPFPSQSQLLIITIIVIIVILKLIELFRNNGSAILNVSSTLAGIFYVSLFFGTFIGLRELFVPFDFPMGRYFQSPDCYTNPEIINQVYQWGGYTVISVLAMIWICDTAAFYIGSAFGKHKLFPRVSPNKSWEGAIGGFLFAVMGAVATKFLILPYLSLGSAIILGIIVGIFGQIGDLIESLFKRDAGVKDSSNFIPGHGGILDRFDSLLLVSPIVYLYLDFVLFS
ncbi:MAG: phosphatidate cytidylyltransferase [Bacteroidota bacterium]|nr:phosphatidate cytidylyltransferase [Bacteroidota bacterium]